MSNVKLNCFEGVSDESSVLICSHLLENFNQKILVNQLPPTPPDSGLMFVCTKSLHKLQTQENLNSFNWVCVKHLKKRLAKVKKLDIEIVN